MHGKIPKNYPARIRFSVASAGDGFCVVDESSGRDMTGPAAYAVAADSAATLNRAAGEGKRSLMAAIGGIEDD